MRLVAGADDALGGATPDIHHQALVAGDRQAVGHAQIDQAGLFPASHDFDRKSQRDLRFGEKLAGVLGHAQGVGTDGTHRLGRQTA